MELSIPVVEFDDYIRRTIETSFPDGKQHLFSKVIAEALVRTEECFSKVRLPGYSRNGTPFLNHLHGDQSAVFYYYLSNSAYRNGDVCLAEKAMLLNKSRNGVVITYDTALPTHMLLIHSVGTVLGKANYGDFFVATQNVTVGTQKGNAPRFETGVVIYPGSLVVGACNIGAFSSIAAGTIAIDVDCPEGGVLTGVYPEMLIKKSQRRAATEYFSIE